MTADADTAITPPSIPASLDKSWRVALADAFAAPSMAQLKAFLQARKAAGAQIFPRGSDWFNALALTPLPDVRVVILGQDPYHGPGQAHGLCFSVKPGVRPPPSLVNIFKELRTDVGFTPPGHGHLVHWAEQGVLLLNSVLTVEMGKAGAHANQGWERFTDAVIAAVAAQDKPVAFLLWGAYAQKKAAFVQDVSAGGRHLVLKAPHPSPLSAHNGFFGCRHFSRANAFLTAQGRGAIDWSLPPEPAA
ncbi:MULTISPECIES: uracil-DNA glycosylase [unclassified Sphingobium]|uniref:uracil-DNA glycosylase n=1 Tax=unclassified Sphingobium TaxID=2611147 RepID=UPI0022256C5D|nr:MULTISPECIES: uracil-DNA glycosylase [unclassified Sphingobium]MCW2410248.1 uracil-DNA glycosylase [Sphingobium sp. B8D3D]MCW2414060.1 uracil-DNA glycosylase [Sphingobium sp. B8D3A]